MLSGAVTCEQLEAQIAALDIPGALTRFAGMAEPPDAYWRRRHALPWS